MSDVRRGPATGYRAEVARVSGRAARHPGRPAAIARQTTRPALTLLPAFSAALVPTLLFRGDFRFTGRFHGIAAAAGIELAAVGLAFWASAVFSLIMALRRGRLATRGAFGLCRHPTYAWWVWSVVPSCALLLDSWLFFPLALYSLVAARILAKREDDALWEHFGREFAGYEVRVRLLLPFPRIRPIRFRRLWKAAVSCAALGLFICAVYFAGVRPAMLRLGVSRAEAVEAMPGDRSITRHRSGYTQAAVIRAPAEEVWKWLVQVGYKRAGWYNFDAINRLASPSYFIDGNSSSTRIHPELQDLKLGDTIFLVPALGMTVAQLQPARVLVLVGDPTNPDAQSNACWAYRLDPLGADACRVVVRFRSTYPDGFLWALVNMMVNEIGGAMIQQPAMLAGLRWRAEKAFHAQRTN
jgi:protein-S-isoprenylcysteine O-methyltransferase Ste14